MAGKAGGARGVEIWCLSARIGHFKRLWDREGYGYGVVQEHYSGREG